MVVTAYRPGNLAEALQVRVEQRAIPLAGGTDLMVKHRRHSGLAPVFERPILFLGHLEEIRYVRLHEASALPALEIGAAATLTDLLNAPETPSVLKQAIVEMASPALRNVATLVGNVCNASPAGDTLPALYCLDAQVVLASSKGERRLGIAEFILGPGKTALRDDELVRAVTLPIVPFDVADYRKVGTRKANALSKLSFLGLARREGDTVRDIRLAFGAVAPTVVRSRELESRCIGLSRDELAQQRADLLDAYARLIVPIDDQRSTANYREAVALRLLEHFLTNEQASTTGTDNLRGSG